MDFSPKIVELIKALSILPGVGPKSARRMAFHLLERNREGAKALAKTLNESMALIQKCEKCRIFCETKFCNICQSSNRDNSVICVVETPADVVAIETSATFSGVYFVLLGRLSPIDGIGPDELGINLLRSRLQEDTVQEIILATNATVEGEATAYYLADLAKTYNVKSSRIAHGVPMGGELEYVDPKTISRALVGRELVV